MPQASHPAESAHQLRRPHNRPGLEPNTARGRLWLLLGYGATGWCTATSTTVRGGCEISGREGAAPTTADRMSASTGASQPSDFTNNGWVVEALQGAWSAITTTPVPQDDPAAGVFRVDHLRLALDAALRGGGDTDTVAAIAGGLLGAAYGASAVPADGRRVLQGWPRIRARDLVALATRIVKADEPFSYDPYRMTPVQHPHDDRVWLADVAALQSPHSAWMSWCLYVA